MNSDIIMVLVGAAMAVLGVYRFIGARQRQQLLDLFKKDIDDAHQQDLEQADENHEQRMDNPDGAADRAQQSIDRIRRGDG
jgi:hypothetical protein